MEKVLLKNLKPHTIGIYKLTYPNGKIYIGLSNDIKRRMYEHNNSNRLNSGFQSPCDLAIKKYGVFEEIEILEYFSIENRELMGEREKYWIKYFKSNNKQYGYNLTEGGENSTLVGEKSPGATFSDKEVLDIRKRRFLEKEKEMFINYILIKIFQHLNIFGLEEDILILV